MTMFGNVRDPVRRAAHVHERLLLGPIGQRPQCSRLLEHVERVQPELPPLLHRGLRGVGRRLEAARHARPPAPRNPPRSSGMPSVFQTGNGVAGRIHFPFTLS